MGRATVFASVLALALVLALVACAPSEPARPPSKPTPATHALDDATVASIIAKVTKLRGFEPKRSVKVDRVSDADFLERFGTERNKPLTDLGSHAFLAGFDFEPAPGERAAVTDTDAYVRRVLAGYYDPMTDAVVVHGAAVESEADWRSARRVLAHEVEHALQAQRFARHPKPAATDEGVAELAAFEGDAELMGAAYIADEDGVPLVRNLLRIRQRQEASPIDASSDAVVANALDLQRERFAFPYREGFWFVSDLYRAGGFELVDEALASPPVTTEQVLHPEKYLMGELPRAIDTPKPPAGGDVVDQGSLGELDVRIVFDRCYPGGEAAHAAEGWDGDRYAVIRDAKGAVDVVWITAWDGKGDAAKFESFARESAECWHDNAFSALDPAKIAARTVVVRKDDVVVFLRGADATEEKARGYLGLVGPSPAFVPISAAKVPPRVPLAKREKGRIDGGVYRSGFLGLEAPIPSGMAATMTDGTMDLTISNPLTGMRASIGLTDHAFGRASNEREFDELGAMYGKQVPGLVRFGGGDTDTPLGRGVDQWYEIPDRPFVIHVVLVPVCNQAGSILLIEQFATYSSKTFLDDWMSTVHWTKSGDIPACGFLDPR